MCSFYCTLTTLPLGTMVEIKDCFQKSEEECIVLCKSPILQIQKLRYMEMHFPQACVISRDGLQSGHLALRTMAFPIIVHIFKMQGYCSERSGNRKSMKTFYNQEQMCLPSNS